MNIRARGPKSPPPHTHTHTIHEFYLIAHDSEMKESYGGSWRRWQSFSSLFILILLSSYNNGSIHFDIAWKFRKEHEILYLKTIPEIWSGEFRREDFEEVLCFEWHRKCNASGCLGTPGYHLNLPAEKIDIEEDIFAVDEVEFCCFQHDLSDWFSSGTQQNDYNNRRHPTKHQSSLL